MIRRELLTLFFIIFLVNVSEVKSKGLFTQKEKLELEYLKSKEFIDSNFISLMQKNTRKRLEIFIASASKAHKEFLIKESKSGAWKAIDKKDHKLMMEKLLKKLEKKKED
jgi:hypothetical protein